MILVPNAVAVPGCLAASSVSTALSRSNVWVAEQLRDAASLMAAQGASPFRVSALRLAADAIAGLPTDLRDLAQAHDHQQLEAMPGVGRSIAGAVAEILATGHWGFLERLRGAAEPEALFGSVPGIGAALAQRIHDALHIGSLEELAIAANDGRLGRIAGFGPRRAAFVRGILAEMLGRVRLPVPRIADEPGTALLLDVDHEYLEKARRDELRTIEPKRINPDHEARLPVLHTTRGRWQFSAFYHNTALAHRPGRTDDWVVVYFFCDDRPEGRRTIVTETRGERRAYRVVRRREAECCEHVEQAAAAD